jgi:pimeloyl-ACP methyl ester carboxylesterase
MPSLGVNGVRLHYEVAGAGPSVVLVHGSWGDHHNWDLVAPRLAERFRVVRYDRRGHTSSTAPPGQGSVREDAADLLALIDALRLAPALVVGSSFGAIVTLRAAMEKPGAFRGLAVHEPPLFGLLQGDPSVAPVLAATQQRIQAVVDALRQDREAGTRLFIETIAFGPGGWDQLDDEDRATFVGNAPTWLDEVGEPEAFTLDVARLRRFDRPALLTQGTTSAPFFPKVMDVVAGALPKAERHTFQGAGHVPHFSHPDAWLEVVGRFAARTV